ncbi:hypothetical protein COJ85_31075 [Bacillus sp. AFS076308]|nr:hypothetical protein COJ85_31075 [Bacillus sp. AFS076308]PGV48311.1 hypothetical protein COD92_27135 [Bacillus sp. AFS037270]
MSNLIPTGERALIKCIAIDKYHSDCISDLIFFPDKQSWFILRESRNLPTLLRFISEQLKHKTLFLIKSILSGMDKTLKNTNRIWKFLNWTLKARYLY